jgi:hypothetical protein
MKASQTLVESLADVDSIRTGGDVRRLVANSMLALVRKEISATDVLALASGCDSISNSINTELKVAKAQIELREKGAEIGKVAHMGSLLIGSTNPIQS